MAERKSVNKYYPPDWDPSKGSVNKYVGQHPLRDRARKLSQGILVIRFELPYNIWCGGCNSHVGMGVRYNAEKTKVGNYYTTPIYKFRMKCHLCDNYFEIQTDPKNHDYVILCGARRKEQRWDPKENEQIVPEDKATQKKLVTDAMYKLEHGSDDKQKGKSLIPTVGQIVDERDQYKEDYIINKIAREKFRNEKKAIKVTEAADKELLLKSSLNITLVKETEDDKKLAGLLKLKPTETFDEKQIQKRKEIESRPIFERSNSKEITASQSKGRNTKINLAKSIALNKRSPFDLRKSPSDSAKQMKDFGIRKRTAISNFDQTDIILPKHTKNDSDTCSMNKQSATSTDCSPRNGQDTSRTVKDISGHNINSIRYCTNCDNGDKIVKNSGQNNKTSQTSSVTVQNNVTNALGLVSAYSDSESNSSEG